MSTISTASSTTVYDHTQHVTLQRPLTRPLKIPFVNTVLNGESLASYISDIYLKYGPQPQPNQTATR